MSDGEINEPIGDDARGPLGRLGVTYRRSHDFTHERLIMLVGGRVVSLVSVRIEERDLIEKLVYALAGNGAREVP